MSHIVLNGDNIDVLKKYPDNYFDAVVTDPPYGLGKEPDAKELMRSWVETGYHEVKGSGFMGKEWDAFVPQPIFWKEVFRVLKHGGHVLAFYGTRTYDWGVMAMRFAGFEVRDTIYWHYGSGFPKSHNISKAIDKMQGAEREVVGVVKGMGKQNPEWNGVAKGRTENSFKEKYDETTPSTEEAKQWDGWGSALKPASEPIVMARKPLEKGLSIAENVLKYGTGAINIDGCRIGHNEEQKFTNREQRKEGWNMDNCGFDSTKNTTASASPQGRFPANLIMTHHPECECNGLKKVKGVTGGKNDIVVDSKFGQVSNIAQKPFDYADENGEETVEDWNCHPDCPIKIMDEQSGVLKSGKLVGEYNGFGNNGIYGKSGTCNRNYEGDKGGASRFFYCAKASKAERNKGLEGFEEKLPNTNDFTNLPSARSNSINTSSGKERIVLPNRNFHPTVKPIKLMQYLVRLVTPPNGIVLDPFCGSGTTGIACKVEGFQFVGIEQDPEYTKIAEARINNYIEDKEEVKKSTTIENKDIQQGLLF